MFVSGIVATTALIGVSLVLLGAALLLAYIDKSWAKNRTH